MSLDWSGLVLLAESAASGVSQSPTEQLLELVNNHPILSWMVTIFTIITPVIFFIDRLLDLKKKYFSKSKEVTEDQLQEWRQSVISKVGGQTFERQQKSLHQLKPLGLRRTQEVERGGQNKGYSAHKNTQRSSWIDSNILEPARKLITKDSQSPRVINPDQSTLEIFENVGGRLLILGDAGSGKTNELLTLTQSLLNVADSSSHAPIPVIFELSEWTENLKFEEWLSQKLKENYNVPLIISERWIRDNQILPLLDGLDELRRLEEHEKTTPERIDALRKERQIRCIEEIDRFLSRHQGMKLVVCCRKNEYANLASERKDFRNLKDKIFLEPLSDEQIKDYLSQEQPWLWDELQSQPQLLEQIRTPLFLMMLVVAYPQQEQKSIRSKEEIVKAYITAQLNKSRISKHYSAKKTFQYLGWLATRLEAVGQTEFLIERLQPFWINFNRPGRKYSFIVGLLTSLYFGLSIFWISTLMNGALAGIFLGLLIGLMTTFWYTKYSLASEEIVPRESLRIDWKFIKRKVNIINPKILFILWLFLTFAASYFYFLDKICSIQRRVCRDQITDSWAYISDVFGLDNLIETTNYVRANQVEFVWVSFCASILVATIFIVEGILLLGLRVDETPDLKKLKPNQGINESLKMGLLSLASLTSMFVILGAIVIILEGQPESQENTFPSSISGDVFPALILSSLTMGLILSLFFGMNAVLNHLALRIVLWKSSFAPRNYKHFLAYVEDNYRFVQRVGGRYRFAHGLIRKQFAETYRETSG
ncbi:MAG: NACHT domain-containing protein [Spirulinaceae cyanobacterium]